MRMIEEFIIIPTKFIDMQTGKEKIGVRCDWGGAIVTDDEWDFMPDDELEILTKLLLTKNDYLYQCHLDGIAECKIGVTIKGKKFSWQKIKPIFDGKRRRIVGSGSAHRSRPCKSSTDEASWP